ncbi:hypothetical protein QZH41_001280 [Actinostola sp. cb2023]|nr:hypothetical protein QZH41_001280 [Actinostola sp. cb2023]
MADEAEGRESIHEVNTREREETPVVAEMFSALLTVMKAMNQRFVSFSEPLDHDESDMDLHTEDEDERTPGDAREADVMSLDTRVKNLTSNENSGTSSLLQDIAQDLDISEKTGGSINEGLAKILTSLLKEKIPDDKAQAKIDKYPRPANVEGLRTVRTHDSKSQKSQNVLVASLVAMTKATDLLLQQKGQTESKELVTYLTDAIALAMQCYHDINGSRRQAMKKDLYKDYAALCNSWTVPSTSEYLFGNLSKLTKDITEANKLTKKVRPPKYNNKGGRKYGSNSRYYSNREPKEIVGLTHINDQGLIFCPKAAHSDPKGRRRAMPSNNPTE